MDEITVTIINDSTFDHTYSIKDGVSGATSTHFIVAGGQINISLRSNHALDDGYGDLYWQQDGSGAVNHRGLLRDGESVSL
jgi:hypothetical protein